VIVGVAKVRESPTPALSTAVVITGSATNEVTWDATVFMLMARVPSKSVEGAIERAPVLIAASATVPVVDLAGRVTPPNVTATVPAVLPVIVRVTL
jgi:hypothetical protein